MPKKKAFDCVDMQDKAALAIHEITKDMTREEQLAYWAEQTEALRRRQEAARAKQRREAA